MKSGKKSCQSLGLEAFAAGLGRSSTLDFPKHAEIDRKMKKLITIILLGGLIYYSYGEFFSNPLIGKWDLDVEKAVVLLKEAGASKSKIDEYIYKADLNKSYLYVTRKEMEVSQFGELLKVKYKIQSRNNNCVNVLWDRDQKPTTFCVSGDSLEWYSEDNFPLAYYKKRE